MAMFLMAAAMSLLAVAVCAVLFAAATRDERAEASQGAMPAAREPQRFFATAPAALPRDEATAKEGAEPELVPVEALLLKIEQHIRLEQAAAEAFLHRPTDESLHSRTTSRLVN
jgi:cbb3-type cytochrome oxidase subunit 3